MPNPSPRRASLSRQTAVLICAALLLGFISAGQDVISDMPPNRYTFGHALIMETPFWVFWAALYPLIVLIARRLEVTRKSVLRTLPLHVLIGVGVAVLHYTTTFLFM